MIKLTCGDYIIAGIMLFNCYILQAANNKIVPIDLTSMTVKANKKTAKQMSAEEFVQKIIDNHTRTLTEWARRGNSECVINLGLIESKQLRGWFENDIEEIIEEKLKKSFKDLETIEFTLSPRRLAPKGMAYIYLFISWKRDFYE